jgi:Glyoxalase-like domain
MKARVDLVLDCAEPAKLVEFWREALDYRECFTDTSFAVLVPKEGSSPPLVLQGVPEPRAGKNRMHLDIVVDDIESRSRATASARRSPARQMPPTLRRHEVGEDVRSRTQRVLRLHRRRVVTTHGAARP